MRILRKINGIFSKRQKRSFFLLFLLVFASGILEMFSVSALIPVIMAMLDPDAFRHSLESLAVRLPLIGRISEVFGFSSDEHLIIFFAVFLMIVYVVKALFQLLIYYRQNRFINLTKARIRTDVMQHYMSMPYEAYLTLDIPSILTLTQRDTSQAFLLILAVLQLCMEAVIVVFMCAFLLFVNTPMTLMMILILLILTLINTKFLRPRLNRIGEKDRENETISYQRLLQGIHGLKDLRVLHREQSMVDHYHAACDRQARAATSYAVLNIAPRLLIETVFIIAILGFMLLVVLRGGNSTVLVSQMTAFGIAAIRLMPGVNRINTHVTTISFYEPSLTALYEHQCQFRDKFLRLSTDTVREQGEKDVIPFQEQISLSRITYRYPDAEEYIFREAELSIPRGTSVGIRGSSGAGKSTLADILMGLLPVASGEILCDGVNVLEHYAAWLSNIGYIPQSIYLTDETIRENIAFGIPVEEIDDDRIWQVLKEAQLDAFVKKLKDGPDTVIGERGIRLSGGQRQRIGIARVLYHDPEILVFDEATSALDNETEAALMHAIESFKGRKTMLIIAHRLNTIENCDVIYEIRDGKITLSRG